LILNELSPRLQSFLSQRLWNDFMNELRQTVHQGRKRRDRSVSHERHGTAHQEIEGVLLHIRGLILVRALLEQRGASELELAEHSAELNRQRNRLAELVRDAA
jgi:hypothetical protein